MLNTSPATSVQRRMITTSIATLVAGTLIAMSISTHAEAGSRERLFWGGLAVGVVSTAIIANEVRRSRERDYYEEDRWERHVNRCYRAYRSYDEDSDTYIDLRGNERRCRK